GQRIEARIGGAISTDRELAANDSYVELVVARAGGIDGWISNMEAPQSRAIATSVADRRAIYRAEIDSAGTFHFDALPAGDYDVHVRGHNAIATARVTVVAGAHIPLVLPWVADQ